MKKHLLWIYKNTKICIILLMAIATLCNQNVGVVYAQLDTGTGGGQGLDTGTGDITLDFELNNPLAGSGVNTITDFVKRLLDIVLTIGVPVIAVFIILAGFKFVTARGNPSEIEKAKNNLFGVMIGAAILLGAWVLANALGETVNELVTP